MFLLLFPMFLFACERAEHIDIKCGEHKVVGKMWPDRSELKIDGITRMLPLAVVFTDEHTVKYAPEYLPNPSFAMTVKDYSGLSLDNRKIDFLVYSRKGKVEYYELEIEDDKWQCNFE